MDFRAHTLLGWQSEVRLLRWLGLGQGGPVLDMGCGPGYVAAQLLKDFPALRLVGMDHDRELVRFAVRETADCPGRAAFLEARADACPLAGGSVSFVFARYLFQHLADPLAVAREAHRVLTPGGRLVVIDVDAGLWGVTDPPLLDAAQVAATAVADAPHGVNRFIGRRLWRILETAGFADVQVDAFVYHSDALGLAPFAVRLDERVLAAPDGFVMLAGLLASGVRRADHR